MTINRIYSGGTDWDSDAGSYSESSDIVEIDGLDLDDKDDVLVIGIDFGTTYDPDSLVPCIWLTVFLCELQIFRSRIRNAKRIHRKKYQCDHGMARMWT